MLRRTGYRRTGFSLFPMTKRFASEAIALGYRLYGSPAATFDGARVILAQALIWKRTGLTD